MFNVEEETRRVEQLYARITGVQPPKDITRTLIPADVDAEAYVRERLRRLEALLMGSGAMDPSLALPTLSPRIAVSQRPNEWTCGVELPGVAKSDISVQLSGAELRVGALRRGFEGEGRGSVVYAESSPCRFERVIPVPPAIRADTATARLENGVLMVRFALQSTAMAQQIEIGAA